MSNLSNRDRDRSNRNVGSLIILGRVALPLTLRLLSRLPECRYVMQQPRQIDFRRGRWHPIQASRYALG